MAAAPAQVSEKLAGITIRPLRETDLATAGRIFRLAFGTFLGLPDPNSFCADCDYVRTRWRADPEAALAAEAGGELVASNFVTTWGTVGFFGPLTVRPDLWNRGIGERLMEPTMNLFDHRKTTLAGLFTFAHSPKHLHLYQKYGFWPRFLTRIMSAAVRPPDPEPEWSRYSELGDSERDASLWGCIELTNEIYPGLNLEREIRAVQDQALGDTVLLWDNSRLAAFAVCHCGRGTEAGDGACYIKFGAARPGALAALYFDRLLNACAALAHSRGLSRLVAGMNTARHEAYCKLMERGFRTDFQGVAMQRDNEPGYNRSGVYAIDDWR